MSQADPLQVATTFSLDEVREACDCADQKLNEIAEKFDFLLSLSPTNTTEAMQCWFANGCEGDPDFHYRDLNFDPGERDLGPSFGEGADADHPPGRKVENGAAQSLVAEREHRFALGGAELVRGEIPA